MLKICSLHFTAGGAWHGVRTRGYELWLEELGAMLAGDNPRASIFFLKGPARIEVDVTFTSATDPRG